LATTARVTEVSFEAPHSTLRVRRPAPRVVALVISGTDIGEHGDAPLVELGELMRIYTDAPAFDAELEAALEHARR
jgi:hypothetical protein